MSGDVPIETMNMATVMLMMVGVEFRSDAIEGMEGRKMEAVIAYFSWFFMRLTRYKGIVADNSQDQAFAPGGEPVVDVWRSLFILFSNDIGWTGNDIRCFRLFEVPRHHLGYRCFYSFFYI